MGKGFFNDKVLELMVAVHMFHTLNHTLAPLTQTPFHFQIGARFAPQQDPLPYMVSQPLPWQVHSVSHSRKGSKADEVSCNEMCSSVYLLSHASTY